MPIYVAIGNCAFDVTPSGNLAGGCALYASVAASRLGLEAVAVTNFGRDFLDLNPPVEGVELIRQNNITTRFGFSYDSDGNRKMILLSEGAKISPDMRDIAADILHFCPIADEFGSELVAKLAARHPGALTLVTPQGWMRHWDANGGKVLAKKWASAKSILPQADILVLSKEDLKGNDKLLREYVGLTGSERKNRGIVVLTDGKVGATAYLKGKEIFKPSFKAKAIDPTGAGDVFAAAFAIRRFESASVKEALAFAHAAAAFAVEASGASGVASRQKVESRAQGKI